jgi:hypothetical protein
MSERNKEVIAERSLFEKLLYVGIGTFFLWPFIQLWSIKAVPLFESDTHQRAAIALENIMEEALTKPFKKMDEKSSFQKIAGCEDIGLVGKIELFPHPDYERLILLRGQVSWGGFPFSKTLTLEYLKTRTRP